MTSYEFFKLAERIELLARDLYAELADEPATPPGLRKIFLGLADEEQGHAQRIQLLAGTSRGAAWLDQLNREAGAALAAVTKEMEAFISRLKARRRPDDLVVVLDQLVEMETRFASVHAEELAKLAEPSVAKLFAALAKQDQRHRTLLEEARRPPELQSLGTVSRRRLL
jgi:rubrerythrin